MSGTIEKLPRCVLDSNVWIHALTEQSQKATYLVDSVLDGRRVAVVSAYIYEEVDVNLERELGAGEYVDQLRTQFAKLMTNPHVEEPDTWDVYDIDLDEVRNSKTAKFLEQVLDIQEKDVPIVFLAWEHSDEEITIYTFDEHFLLSTRIFTV